MTIEYVEIKIPEEVTTSVQLQTIIDSTGNKPAKFIFSQTHRITINSLIRFYNYAYVLGNDCIFKLMDNAPVKVFGLHVPLIGSKYNKGVIGLIFDSFEIDGNYQNQKLAYAVYKTDHGKGFHDQILLGNISDPQFENVQDCEFRNLILGNSYGDGIRIEGGANIIFENITSNFGGHDVIHLSTVKTADVYKIKVPNMKANNVVRTRSCIDIDVHGCNCTNGAGYDTGPVFQSECITENRESKHIRYFDNVIKITKGSGWYVVADQPASDLEVFDNLVISAGNLEKAINIPIVGGGSFLGWESVKFHHNTVVNCKGYGVVDGTFKYQTKQKGSVDVYNNIFVGVRESNTVGVASGTAIAHISGAQTTMTARNNCVWDNTDNYYNITQTGAIEADPLFVDAANGDYHLQKLSPCNMTDSQDSQIGCYANSNSSTDNNNPSLDENTPTTGDSTGEGTDTTTTDTQPVQKTLIETKKRYTSKYPKYGMVPVQITYLIPAGDKVVRLDSVGMFLATTKKGCRAYGKVSYQIPGGDETVIKEWVNTDTNYQGYSLTLNKAFLKGKDVTLRYDIKTNCIAYKACMKNPRVDYTLI